LVLLAPTRPFQLSWERHVSLQTKQSMLEDSESSTLFPCENLVFEINTSCKSEFSRYY
jgi:hypothetical protein